MAQEQPGQEWAQELVRRVGAAAKSVRGTKSAKWLSDRTAELGYRISPTVIAKLDSGHRGSVLSVPELLILAAALDIPPALLILPTFPDGTVELLPGYKTTVPDAVDWLAGSRPLPAQKLSDGNYAATDPPNDGIRLIEVVAYRKELARKLQQNELLLTLQLDQRSEEQRKRTEDEVEILKAGLVAADQDIERLRLRLLGNLSGGPGDV